MENAKNYFKKIGDIKNGRSDLTLLENLKKSRLQKQQLNSSQQITLNAKKLSSNLLGPSEMDGDNESSKQDSQTQLYITMDSGLNRNKKETSKSPKGENQKQNQPIVDLVDVEVSKFKPKI